MRKFYFINRVVDVWNSLSNRDASANNINVFEYNKGNKDGLLHGLIRRALGLPVGFLAGEATQGE